MNVSQLVDSTEPTSPKNNNNDSAIDQTRIKPSSLKFILSPSNDTEPTHKPTTSNEQVFTQCSKLCESIWQLRLQHTSLSEKERESMIDNLSKSAQTLFQTIRTSEGTKKNSSIRKYNEEEEQEEDYEEEDEDENDEMDSVHNDLNSISTNKIKDHAEYELIRQARNLYDSQSRPKYRRRNRRSMVGQKCHSCSTTETPEWRRGPDGARTLCNACGLHYSKLLRKGSIGVQTNNYLLSGGTPIQTPSIVSASAISDNNKLHSAAMIESARNKTNVVNFPFVLDSKYGGSAQKNRLSASSNSTNITNSSCSNSSSVNTANNSQQFYTQQQPFKTADRIVDIPSLPQQLPSLLKRDVAVNEDLKKFSSSNSSNQNSITPLRIHQWKNN